jgi:hypothetical protein
MVALVQRDASAAHLRSITKFHPAGRHITPIASLLYDDVERPPLAEEQLRLAANGVVEPPDMIAMIANDGRTR